MGDHPLRPHALLTFEDCAIDPRVVVGVQKSSQGMTNVVLNTQGGASYVFTDTPVNEVMDAINSWHVNAITFYEWEEQERQRKQLEMCAEQERQRRAAELEHQKMLQDGMRTRSAYGQIGVVPGFGLGQSEASPGPTAPAPSGD